MSQNFNTFREGSHPGLQICELAHSHRQNARMVQSAYCPQRPKLFICYDYNNSCYG